ncbi:hypothetical protein [Paraclostridium sordellii]|uniref:hypothetical protein n=1 Tax=Paraclostridium sordellii TaxID=1505 RepID=UPI0005E8EBE8|nr:hypothetical protein [Paeniclostridium sordellii]CEP48176.1 Uncharacterised protein [[Clostridium] sordellii] [Paeniclostridium sordellii]
MTNIDVYYNTLLDMLEHFTYIINEHIDSGGIEEDKVDALTEIELKIRGEIIRLNELRTNISKYENLNNLVPIIIDISNMLHLGYLYNNFNRLKYIIDRINEILQNLSSEDIDNIESEYNEEDLKLNIINSNEYKISNLYFYPTDENVLLALSFNESDENRVEFEDTIDQITSLKILISILDKLNFKNELNNSSYIITNINYESEDFIYSYIDMIKVYRGNVIHERKNSQYQINIRNENKFESVEQYKQFSDTIYILSEFNEEINILNKYLKVYQVIENFMFRIPLCELINETSEMFTIRDFNRLYSKIENSEKDALKKFFRKSLLEKDINDIVLISLVKNYIDEFKLNHASDLIRIKQNLINKGFLASKDIENIKNLDQIESNKNMQNNLIGTISNLVYSLRNSIVHNKATEFHLTNNNLDIYTQAIIDELLIPILIEIVFFLITNKCKSVTYESRRLELY